MLQNMKIKIKYPTHSKLVQEILFEAGYEWRIGGSVIRHVDQEYLIIDDGLITFSEEEVFVTSANPEYELKSDGTQWKLEKSLGQLLKEKIEIKEEIQKSRPPVGLRPKRVWMQLRVEEILQAMRRYNVEGYTIPTDWFDELDDLAKNLINENS